MLKIRYLPRFAVIPQGNAVRLPADMRLLNGASHPPNRRVRRVRPPMDMRPGSLKEAREKMTVRRKPQVWTDETG